MTDEPTGNGWGEWSKFILSELKRLNTQFEKLDEKMDSIVKRLIKVERVAWLLSGGLAVMSPVLIWAIIRFLGG